MLRGILQEAKRDTNAIGLDSGSAYVVRSAYCVIEAPLRSDAHAAGRRRRKRRSAVLVERFGERDRIDQSVLVGGQPLHLGDGFEPGGGVALVLDVGERGRFGHRNQALGLLE